MSRDDDHTRRERSRIDRRTFGLKLGCQLLPAAVSRTAFQCDANDEKSMRFWQQITLNTSKNHGISLQ
jgi:hypothetical protein